jgi:signal transduction histidine kinase
VQIPDFVRSIGFRLIAWYAAVFGASVAILLGVVYWIALSAVEQQIDDSVLRESRLLADVYATRGREALERGIRRRTGELTSPRRYYLFQERDGRVVAGNLPPMAPSPGRFVASVPEGNPEPGTQGENLIGPDSMIAQGRLLAGGEYLLVGENRYRLVKTQEAIISAVIWGIAITVLLALGGGIVLASGYLRRIEEVNRTIRRIMDGELSQRVPTRGGRDEMDVLAAHLNAMLERIQTLMESLKRVSDDIAHDLRTPLSRLRQRLEAARAGMAAAPAHVIEQSIAELDSILDTFTALLRIAQIESGTRRAAFAQIDLSQVVSAVAETYAAVAEDHQQKLAASTAGRIPVCGDRELLLQMIANLVENSIRHAHSGGTITLRSAEEAGVPVLQVTDTGPGIPEPERAKVFRRFYRLEQHRTTPGNGLGLALVKAVVELHGAQIELSDNRPGLAVSVRFRRPTDSHVARAVVAEPAISAPP